MRLRFLWLLAVLLPAGAAAQAPAPAGFSRLPSGTDYQLFRRAGPGQPYAPRPLLVATDSAYRSRVGRALLAHLTYLTGRDSVLQSSRKQLRNRPAPVPLQASPRPGTPEEALSLLLPGDSAVFRFAADSLIKGQPVPGFLRRAGNVLVLRVAVVQLISAAEATRRLQVLEQEQRAIYERQLKARSAKQTAKDEALIKRYLTRNKLTAKAKKTPGGTWYYFLRRGTGPLPKAGQQVSVQYRGTLLATGQEFDSSYKRGSQPFEFALGRGQVIQGWDQGIAVLPKGSKAVLIIPSPLGYGERGAGADIPPNAVLRFEVELVGMK